MMPKIRSQVSGRTPWRPLLEGAAARQAQEAVLAIARDLEGPPPPIPPGGKEIVDFPAGRPSILRGYAGRALLAFALERWRPGEGYGETAIALLETAVERLAESDDTVPDLYSGFAGVAWVVEKLGGELFEDDGEDLNAGIDEALYGLLSVSPWNGSYDLINGLAGFGIYALSRPEQPTAVACLERVVERLAELAEERDGGYAWPTPPELLLPGTREFYPQGMVNLGAAHGMPGILVLLARACAAGVAVARARPLLDGGVSWLMAQRLETGSCAYPDAIPGDGSATGPSRAAWCYGDPGVAAALLVAARAVGEPAWEAEALRTARLAARRTPEDSGMLDACLCHGTLGLAHLLNRMYQATGDRLCRESALRWYAAGLEARSPGQGYGGYINWSVTIDRDMAWTADPTFLSGALGIALTLLAASTEVDPWWDELLLASPVEARSEGGRRDLDVREISPGILFRGSD